MRLRKLMVAAVVCGLPALGARPASAEVVHAAPAGFTVRTVVQVPAPAHRVYEAIANVASWWDPEHTYSGDAKNLSIEPRANGCFCERLAGGGTIAHMTVIYAAPGKTLRLSGGLGPLQELPATGVLTFMLTEAAGSTTVEMTYGVGGYSPKGLDGLAPIVDQVLAVQVGRLAKSLEPAAAK